MNVFLDVLRTGFILSFILVAFWTTIMIFFSEKTKKKWNAVFRIYIGCILGLLISWNIEALFRLLQDNIERILMWGVEIIIIASVIITIIISLVKSKKEK